MRSFLVVLALSTTPVLTIAADVSGAMLVDWMPKLNNNILRYGYFCGPGPDEKVWGYLEPFDAIDEACQQHDMAYKRCLEDLSKDLGYDVPKAVHQIMPVRGFAPAIIIRQLFKVAPKYMTCMHRADKSLVERFEYFLQEDNLPHWWSRPHAAPKGIPGTEGYKEACALGFSGYCILPSQSLFKLALMLFRSSVELDRHVHHLLSDLRAHVTFHHTHDATTTGSSGVDTTATTAPHQAQGSSPSFSSSSPSSAVYGHSAAVTGNGGTVPAQQQSSQDDERLVAMPDFFSNCSFANTTYFPSSNTTGIDIGAASCLF